MQFVTNTFYINSLNVDIPNKKYHSNFFQGNTSSTQRK